LSKDEEHGFDINNDEVDWGNKQMLKFYLDFFAFIGTHDSTVRGALQHGGDVAIQITKIMEAALRAGDFGGVPW
jgi:hypothetical protein